MSSVSGISSSYSSYADYGKFASGKKIQSAADGAAELSIIEKEDSQIRGLDAGSNNMESGKDVMNIADGALGSITDYLQRIRELSLGAMNTATTTDSDRRAMQDEIDQLKLGIADVASQTQYNTKNLLDGSQTDFRMAVDANGSDVDFNTTNATLQALGIADYDVTKNFDLRTIDNAIEKVSSARGSMGAQTNRFDYALAYNSNASYNLTGAKSKLEDLDYPQAVSEKKKKELLQTYSLMMQKRKQDDEARQANMFWTR